MDRRVLLMMAIGIASMAGGRDAAAQLGSVIGGSKQSTPLDRGQPVAFTADDFVYDRTSGIVTATGHVEAWQNDHVLRADKVTFDRNTNVAAATGNVVIVEPDGQVLFSDYAELTQGMREGVLKGMRTLLAENGKLVANGARRTDGKLNELTHAVYTTCDLCKTDPSRPPLWQLRAYTARQDLENHKIEYEDATLDLFGIPIGYLPYFSHPDPSVRRASGFLVPAFGQSSHIGQFLSVPYYWAIDEQQDVTIEPEITTGSGEQIQRPVPSPVQQRHGGGGRRVCDRPGASPNAYIFTKGTFSYDDTWRYGFNINRASSSTYLRDFKVQNYSSVLTSSAFIEGFGVGAYSKLDAIAYQGLATTINQSRLPYVLPRYEYSFYSEPIFGGRFRFDTTDFNVVREQGTRHPAAPPRAWTTSGRSRACWASSTRSPSTPTSPRTSRPAWTSSRPMAAMAAPEKTRGQPTIAAEMRWPFIRDGGKSGSQIIEPIVQLIAAPNAGSFLRRNIPNEDSLDFEFSDQNLFALNRFPGIDRFEGGLRANVGAHGTWTAGGTTIDGLVGQSYKEHVDRSLPPLSGLNRRVSDVVARATITPTTWFDLTARTRVDPAQCLDPLRGHGGFGRLAPAAPVGRLLLLVDQPVFPV